MVSNSKSADVEWKLAAAWLSRSRTFALSAFCAAWPACADTPPGTAIRLIEVASAIFIPRCMSFLLLFDARGRAEEPVQDELEAGMRLTVGPDLPGCLAGGVGRRLPALDKHRIAHHRLDGFTQRLFHHAVRSAGWNGDIRGVHSH